MAIGYYVTIKRGDDFRPLPGPYDDHSDALANVDTGRAKALEYGAIHAFDYFGTSKITATDLPQGIFGK